MSVLLELAILKGSTLADFTQAMAEVSAEHPELKLDMAHGSYHTYADGTGILFAEGTDGDEPLAKALSEKLRRSVMLLYVYDETQWGYFLYENGRALDAFSPIVPEQFTGDPSEIERYKGNAQLVAEHFGVSPQAVERYLVRWTKELLQDGGKAYPGDTYPYGEAWQMADFMNALRHPYAFVPVEPPPTAAPAVFDTALITNDLERWIADIYVIWSVRGGGNWQLFGGYPKTEDNAAILKKLLASDWKINDLTEGIATVNFLVEDTTHKTPETDGWDFGRGMQLIGVFYLVGYIDRAQMVEYSCIIGKIIQGHFHSWQEFCDSYLAGYTQWCKRTFNSVEAEQGIAERQAMYARCKSIKDGPYRLPWQMNLDPAAATSRTATPAAGQDYFAQWLQQEEKWIAAYRRKSRKTLLLLVIPLVIAVMVAFMVGMGLLEGKRGAPLLGSAVTGVQVSLLVTLPVYWYVLHRLGKGRLSQTIQKAVQSLGIDKREQQTLGMQMLAALQSGHGHLDYLDKAPNSQKLPARLLVSGDYFYQSGSRMKVILIRRSDVEFIEAGQENKWQRISARASRYITIYAVYFYYRSSRERRLEGDKQADNGIGFFDPTVRDRAYAMLDRQMKSPTNR